MWIYFFYCVVLNLTCSFVIRLAFPQKKQGCSCVFLVHSVQGFRWYVLQLHSQVLTSFFHLNASRMQRRSQKWTKRKHSQHKKKRKCQKVVTMALKISIMLRWQWHQRTASDSVCCSLYSILYWYILRFLWMWWEILGKKWCAQTLCSWIFMNFWGAFERRWSPCFTPPCAGKGCNSAGNCSRTYRRIGGLWLGRKKVMKSGKQGNLIRRQVWPLRLQWVWSRLLHVFEVNSEKIPGQCCQKSPTKIVQSVMRHKSLCYLQRCWFFLKVTMGFKDRRFPNKPVPLAVLWSLDHTRECLWCSGTIFADWKLGSLEFVSRAGKTIFGDAYAR